MCNFALLQVLSISRSLIQSVLAKDVDETIEYHLLSRKPLIYVHQFTKGELSANSSVCISAWDKLARISHKFSTMLTSLPEPIKSMDFRPLLMDNVALRSSGLTTREFIDAFEGNTPALECKQYVYECTQYGHNWQERVWAERLLWILKEKQKELQIEAYNLSDFGQHWENKLMTIIKTSKVAVNSTPFKGVTDIVVLGKASIITVLVREDDPVMEVDSNTIILELGLGAPVRVYCPNYQGALPRKLGELLSSMYLIGMARALSNGKPLIKAKVYGWLMLRNQFSFGIELEVSVDKPIVNILFISSDCSQVNRDFYHLYKCVV